MQTPFIVSIKCPECGAPLRYPEGTYTFKCAYCASVLRTESGGRDLKYIITSSLTQNEIGLATKKILVQRGVKKLPVVKRITVSYKPFWYFKGMVYRAFTLQGKFELIAKTYSHSFDANEGFTPAFSTLGIKTQVLTLQPYDSERYKESDVFLPVAVDKEVALRRAVELAEKNTAIDISLAVKASGSGKKRISLWNSEQEIVEPTHSTYPEMKTSEAFSRVYIVGDKFFIIYYPVISVLCKGAEKYFGFRLDGVSKMLLEETDKEDFSPVGEKSGGVLRKYSVNTSLGLRMV